MKKHFDDVPINSRVTVDYKNKKVSFSYLPYDEMDKLVFIWAGVVKVFFIFVGIPILIIFMIYMSYVSEYSYIENIIIGTSIELFYNMLLFGILIIMSIIIAKHVSKNYKRYSKIFPKMNAGFSSDPIKHLAIHKNSAKKIIEIPIFQNIMMKYRAYGDFGKQLKKIRIKEYDFNMINKSWVARWIYGKEIRNIYYWKCYFIFYKRPINGKLEIDFI